MIKICNYFFVAALMAALLTGCGSSVPSQNDIEKAVREYVGLARPDIGDVKVDTFKISKEDMKKVGNDDVFFRTFDAHYTVTYGNNPSKHSFIGTMAMVKQGQNWVMKKELCTLNQVESAPIVDSATQAELDKQASAIRKAREQAASQQSSQQ